MSVWLTFSFLLPGLLSAQAVSFEAQGPQVTPPPGNTPAEQKCVVAGRVSNSLTGEPLKKVNIRLARRTTAGGSAASGYWIGPGMMSNGAQGYAAVSEADGSFRIEGIEPGDYMLSGERTGYLHTEYGAKGPMRSGTVLNLRAGQQMTGLSLGLIPQAVITGKVLDEDGDPMGMATIEVLAQNWFHGKLRYMPRGGNSTNDLGEFRVANLSPGKYLLCAQKMNFGNLNEPAPAGGKPDVRPIRTCYPDATTLDGATPIEIKAGQDLSGMDIRLRSAQTFHIRGRVVGSLPENQSERVAVMLGVQGDRFFGFIGSQAMVTKERTFDIAGVSPGSYVANLLVMGGPVRLFGRQPVDVGQADVNDLVLNVVLPGSLRGQIRVVGTPQAGAQPIDMNNIHVHLTPSDGAMMFGRAPNGAAKADGTFTLDNVLAGKYYVQTNVPAGAYLYSARFGQQDVLGKELDLSQGAAGDLELVFHYGAAEVDGRVQASSAPGSSSATGQAGTAPPSASIVLVPDQLNADGSGMHFGNTDQSGTFSIKQVPPGHYRAYAFEELDMNQMQNPNLLKELESKGTEVEVNENDKKQIQLPVISAEDMQQIYSRLGIESQ